MSSKSARPDLRFPTSPALRTCLRAVLRLLLIAVVAMLTPDRGQASTGDCTERNLLEDLTPVVAQGLDRSHNINDGLLCLETQAPNNSLASSVAPGGLVVFDLGAETTVEGVIVQTGGDAALGIALSIDGQTWTTLTATPPSSEMTTHRGLFEGKGRYVGLSSQSNEGTAYIGELLLYCVPPDKLSPPLRFRQGQEVLSLATSLQSELVRSALLALFALLVLGTRDAVRHERRVGMALILASGLVWSVGSRVFSAGGGVHAHDAFHYLMGSRYFAELGYTRLYTCAIQAEQALNPTTDFAQREIRDLTNDKLVGATSVLAETPPRCGTFTEARWERFVQDVGVFKGILGPTRWKQVLIDHGYNPPPAWTLLGRLLAGDSSVSLALLRRLGLIDVLLYALSGAVMVWAFRWRAAGLVAVLWTIAWPWHPAWTAGAFLRMGWLFSLVLGIAALKKQRPGLSGLALGISAQLRIFPVLTAGLVACHLIMTARRQGWAPTRRFLAGGGLALLLLAPAAGLETGGLDGYLDVRTNMTKHESTHSANKMGLGTLLTWQAGHTMEDLHDWRSRDPDGVWQAEVRQRGEDRRWLLVGLRLLSVGVAIAVAVRAYPASTVAILSLGLSMTLVDLSCYYYAFTALFGLLVAGDRRRESLLITLFALTQILPRLPTSIEVPSLIGSLGFIGIWIWLTARVLASRDTSG